MLVGIAISSYMVFVTKSLILFFVFVVGFIFFTIYAVFSLKAIMYFEMYENGLAVIWRSPRQILKSEFNYILFEQIEAVYMNSNKMRYITVKLKNPIKEVDDKFGIMKYQIKDLHEFKENIKEKVQVIENTNLILSYKNAVG
jgi:hypothetical protein